MHRNAAKLLLLRAAQKNIHVLEQLCTGSSSQLSTAARASTNCAAQARTLTCAGLWRLSSAGRRAESGMSALRQEKLVRQPVACGLAKAGSAKAQQGTVQLLPRFHGGGYPSPTCCFSDTRDELQRLVGARLRASQSPPGGCRTLPDVTARSHAAVHDKYPSFLPRRLPAIGHHQQPLLRLAEEEAGPDRGRKPGEQLIVALGAVPRHRRPYGPQLRHIGASDVLGRKRPPQPEADHDPEKSGADMQAQVSPSCQRRCVQPCPVSGLLQQLEVCTASLMARLGSTKLSDRSLVQCPRQLLLAQGLRRWKRDTATWQHVLVEGQVSGRAVSLCVAQTKPTTARRKRGLRPEHCGERRKGFPRNLGLPHQKLPA